MKYLFINNQLKIVFLPSCIILELEPPTFVLLPGVKELMKK